MKWIKLKNIFTPNNYFEWMVSHAANPFAEYISKNIFRIYFTCRNNKSKSYIGYADVDFTSEFNVINVSDKPVLCPGDPGLFDDSGVAMSYLINVDYKKYLYYLGWNLKVTVPWLNTIGLAVWNQQKQIYEKHSQAPVMDRSDEDPFSISYPSILCENGIYRMWYGSNLKWGSVQNEMAHVIKYAESKDAIHWNRTKHIHINLEHKNEYALSKPFVIKSDEIYQMWYSYRGNGDISTYRIGYADSPDGFTWTRKDTEAGIDVSQDGWDSEMICYPFIFDHEGERYMLYNGNGYGKTGFGIAQLIK
ncbi:MAG: hypothetical protein H0X33_07125 [Taibaiella sp.]|nr:hypothetical protein [Taibaiella sp.]